MASINSFGKIKNKYGSSIFSNYKGKNIIKTKPLAVKNPRTDAQLFNREKFKKTGALALILNPFIKRTFANYATYTNSYNIFKSLNARANVITGEYPEFEYDYSKITVAIGELKIAEGGNIRLTEGKNILIEWENSSGNNSKDLSDEVIILLFNEAKKIYISYEKVASRDDKKVEIIIPNAWEIDKLHVYLMFKDSEYEEYSNSVYLGNVILSEGQTDMSKAIRSITEYEKKMPEVIEFKMKQIGRGLIKVENGKEINYELDLNSDNEKKKPGDRAIADLITQTRNVVKQ